MAGRKLKNNERVELTKESWEKFLSNFDYFVPKRTDKQWVERKRQTEKRKWRLS